MSGLQTVHVRVNDAATKQPTPCRIRFTGAEGKYYAPLGRLAAFATDVGRDVGGNVLIGDQPHAFIDGSCEIQLPPGSVHVTIRKGPEFRPLERTLAVTPGKLALRFELERWSDLRAERWHAGDTRCHFLTPHAAILEARAEDVAVVNLLCHECEVDNHRPVRDRAYANILAFSGQRPALAEPGHMVVVNTMNSHPILGRLLLLNCHRVVFPLTFGGLDGFDGWTLADWCDQCHRKGGLVIADDFFTPAADHPHGELLSDLILGKVDALNFSSIGYPGPAEALDDWYRLLDAGLRVPLTAGSGKDCNRMTLGAARTYARLEPGQDLSYTSWIEAVRAGRTFVTNGPLLSLTVNEKDAGTMIDLPEGRPSVHVRAEARHLGPLEVLEVVANHEVVARAEGRGSPAVARLETELPLLRGGWVTARCWGPWAGAHTSPVYVRLEGREPLIDRSARAVLGGRLDKMLEWVATVGHFENDAQRERLASVFRNACARLDNLASRPA
jgi:hypothetical protein